MRNKGIRHVAVRAWCFNSECFSIRGRVSRAKKTWAGAHGSGYRPWFSYASYKVWFFIEGGQRSRLR
jgi:hypothetical protein